MRLPRVLAPVIPIIVLTGCAYIHFGRLPPARMSDAALQQAYSDLSLEHKILKQELVLARRESDTLREALDHSAGDPSSSVTELTRQLEATSQELASVRAGYAKLQAESTTAPNIVSSAASAELVSLKDENTRLRENLEVARRENATMAGKLKTTIAENQEAQSTVAQLTADLRAQKQARDQAENATAALHTQLEAVMARAGRADPAGQPSPVATATGDLQPNRSAGPAPSAVTTSIDPGTPAARPTGNVITLEQAKAPPSGAVPTIELRTSLSRMRAAPAAAATTAGSITSTTVETSVSSKPLPAVASDAPTGAAPAPSTPTASAAANVASASSVAAPAAMASVSSKAQTYTVKPGDTLEKLALRFYGAADQWPKIYGANSDLLSASQGLKPGMQLVIPER